MTISRCISLDEHQDGIEQISTVLAKYKDVNALHLITHGSAGQLQLGNVTLAQDSLDHNADSLINWRGAFSADADILLYGCDVAASVEGQQLVTQLAQLTEADVAASDDLTGNTDLGGDWVLERQTGAINAHTLFNDVVEPDWNGLLSTVSKSFQEGINLYSGTQDTYLNENDKSATYGGLAYFTTDADHDKNKEAQALLRFDSLFGAGTSQIPLGVTISSVSLELNVSDSSDAAANITLHRMLTNWTESSSWDSMSNGVDTNDTEAASAADATVASPATLGKVTITGAGLNASVQAWANGDTNYGWVIINDHDDGWDLDSSEVGITSWRPKLTVQYLVDDPVINNLDGDSRAYTEGAGAVVIDQSTAATVTDTDSTDFDTGTLTVSITAGGDNAEDVLAIRNQGTGAGQIGVSGSNVTYAGTTIGTFTGGSSGTDLVVTLNSNADATATQALIRNITYENTDTDDPTTGARTIRFVLTDGDGGTSANTDTTVTVSGSNDAPTINNLGGDSLTYTEGDGAVKIDQSTAATVADVDSTNFNTGTLTVSITAGGDNAEDVLAIRNQGTGAGQIGVSGSNVTYAGTTIGTFTGGSSGTDLVVTLNSNADTTAAQRLIRNITYENTDTDDPTTGARTIRFVLTDGDGGTSANIDTTVTVSGSNDAPTISNLGGDSLAYTEGDGAVKIDQSTAATVADVDSTNFNTGTLTVSIIAGGDNAEDVLAIRNQGTGAGQIGVSGSNVTYAGTTIGTFTGGSSGTDLVVTLNSNADAAATQALIRNITYENTDTDDPTTGARTIRFVLTDGDGGTSANTDTTVTVSSANDAPTIANLSGDGRAYTEGAGVVIIDQSTAAAVTDVDSSDFNTGTLTVSITAGGDNAEDVLAIRHQGTGAGQIGVSGSNVSYAGTTIGSFTGGSSGVDLVITLNANADVTATQALIQNVTYENMDTDNPTTGARTIRFVLTDGDGGTSTNTDTTVTVSGSNDAPTITHLGGDGRAYTEGAGAVIIDQSTAAAVTDVDSSDFNAGTLTVSITAGGDNAEDVLAIRHQGTGAGQIGVSGSNVSYAGTTIGSFTGGSGGVDLVITLSANADTTATQALIQNITYENTDTGNPTTGARTIRFVLTDGDGGTSTNTDTTVTVSGSNDAPTITHLGGDSPAYTEGAGAVVIDQSTAAAVTDVDSSDFDTGTLTVSITAGGDNAEDVLAIRNQGTGAGQIGVSGSNVSYAGTTIGSFTGGSSGTDLVITLNSNADATATQALIQNITYENTDTDNPTTGNRTVRYVLTDGDGGTSAHYDTTVNFSAVNDVPVITNLGGDTLNYSEGDGAVVIDQSTNAAVSDVDSADFDTGTLTVSFTAGSDNAEDVLAIRNQGTGAGQIGVSGSNVSYAGTTIGSFTGGSGGTNLVITLNSNANATATQALIQNITYENTDTDNPTTGNRTVRYVLTDGDGGTSADYDTTVNFSAVNDVPCDHEPRRRHAQLL